MPSPFNYVVPQVDAESYFDNLRQGRADQQAVVQDQRNNALAKYLPGALQGDAGAQQQALAAGSPDQMIQLKQMFTQMDAPKLQAVKDLRAKGAAGATWAKTPEQWATVQATLQAEAQAAGVPFKEVPFEQKDAMAAMGRTVDSMINEEIERQKLANDTSRTTAQNAASYAQAAAARASAARPAGGMRAPSGYQYVIGEDGQPSLQVIPGGPQDPMMKPLTDEQAKAAGFASRLRDADTRLWREGVQEELKSGYNTTFEHTPVFANAIVTDKFQVGDQARRDFLNAQLRRESGAVIGPSEFDSGQKQYFPEYADKEDVLLNKAASRKQAIYNMYVSAGPRYREEAAKAKTDYEKTMAFIDKKNAAAAKAAGVGGNYRQEQADLLSGKTPGAVAPPPGFKIIGQ